MAQSTNQTEQEVNSTFILIFLAIDIERNILFIYLWLITQKSDIKTII